MLGSAFEITQLAFYDNAKRRTEPSGVFANRQATGSYSACSLYFSSWLSGTLLQKMNQRLNFIGYAEIIKCQNDFLAAFQ